MRVCSRVRNVCSDGWMDGWIGLKCLCAVPSAPPLLQASTLQPKPSNGSTRLFQCYGCAVLCYGKRPEFMEGSAPCSAVRVEMISQADPRTPTKTCVSDRKHYSGLRPRIGSTVPMP